MKLDVNVFYSCLFQMRVKKLKLGRVDMVGNAILNTDENISEIQYLEFKEVTIKCPGFDLCRMLSRMPQLVYIFLDVRELSSHGGTIGTLPDECVFEYLRLLRLVIDDSVASLFDDIRSRSPMIAHLSPISDKLVLNQSWFNQPDRSADIEFGPLDKMDNDYLVNLSKRIFRLDDHHYVF